MAKEQEKKIGKVETVEVVEARPQGLSVMAKAEVESLVDVANRHPRNITEFRDKCQSLATFDEEIAASCFYALPRAGTVIEGPSIRLAEIALSCYKNCIAQAIVEHEDDHFIYATGMCRDLENNVAVRQTVRRRITKKNGQRFDDDMIAVTANAAASIALRNAIFKIVPSAYIKPILDAVKQVAGGKAASMTKTREAALVYLQSDFGIDKERVLLCLKRKSVEDIGREDLIKLRGFITAIKDGDMKADTIFPKPKPKTEKDEKTTKDEAKSGVGSVAESKSEAEKPPKKKAKDKGDKKKTKLFP